MKLHLFLLAVASVFTLGANAQGMLTEKNSQTTRQETLQTDVVVCGGGLAGLCAAVSSARHGCSTVLIQDRPVLGGNTSSEIRVGVCGAFGAQYQETGIMEELQLRNFRMNPLMRYTQWDDAMLSTVLMQPNLKLLLNTSVNGVEMNGAEIAAVKAWNTNAYTNYTVKGRMFIDCTGDGILRLSGAQFRQGREEKSEFNETYTKKGGDSYTMGNSILIQLHKTNEDHPFTAPEWAYHFTDKDFDYPTPASTDTSLTLTYKKLFPKNNNFWWIEVGGKKNTVNDANDFQYELKRIAYGVWEYMKNNPDGRCKGYELDWIGSLPGKRESCRFVGPHILNQNDITSGGHFEDNIAYGGWTIDDHDPEAFFKKGEIARNFKTPPYFGIPFCCLYSINVPNLLFAGRDISATHLGLSSTRIMATCALLGQAAGTGAAFAVKHNTTPAGVRKDYIAQLQSTLEDDDCMLPFRWRKPNVMTLAAKTAMENEPLRNGIDRDWNGKDNGVWVDTCSESLVYTWKKAQTLSGARIIFDSELKHRSKRMPKLEGTTERASMPKMMARNYHIDIKTAAGWQTVYTAKDNYLRLCKISFTPVQGTGLRLVVDNTWGAPKAHVFALDAL